MPGLVLHTRKSVLAAALLLTLAPIPYAQALDALGEHARSTHVTLPPGYFAGNEQGVQLVHDYGAFQLYRVDVTNLNALRRSAADVLGQAKSSIDLPAQPLDPLAQPISMPQAYQRRGPQTETSVYLVQFVGPITAEWLDQVRATGATPFQYLADNAYMVVGTPAQASRLSALTRSSAFMRYAGDLEPFYKLAPALAERARQGHGDAPIDVTVIVADHAGSAASRSFVEQQGTALGNWWDLRDMHALTLTIAESKLPQLALRGDVISIEPYVAPRRMDEVQNQIIAGNLSPSQTGPSGPGYLAWLTGLGFSTNPADYPVVSVVDDGLGNGLVANGAGDSTLTRNRDGVTTRVVFSKSCTTQAPHGAAGHGHINTSIVGGYDTRSGFPFTDPSGYLRGMGVNPFARLGNLKFFRDNGTAAYTTCGSNDQGMLRQQYTDGARISSNSWGGANNVYDASARTYDIGTRDASTTAGNQQMLFIFAAGNDGPGPSTIGSPGTAKNVITVGASENRRPSDEDGAWLDGCGTPGQGADSAMDVIGFSSRGPVGTGRQKPDVIAPGTHVQGTASTYVSYVGDGVCDQYRPSGQTVFASSSGTSHSTPAVAGAASLVHRFLEVNHGPATPSPAAVKAYLIAHPTFLTGTSAGANLPSATQGFGMPNLGNAFSPTLRRIVVDQTTNLTATGQSYTLTGRIANRDEPLRITLAWTDAPAAANSTNSLVNNLNLTVDHNGNTYRGNRFAGQWSTTGGTADNLNNVESVFLAPGNDGTFSITVTAANLAGDGVPGTGTSTDQDFALVCSNCVSTNTFIVDASPTTRQVCAADGANWAVDVAAVGAYTGSVTLSTANPAAGSNSIYTPLSGSVPFGSGLAMNTAGVAPGGYVMAVVGTDGTQTSSDPITLSVSAVAPSAPNTLIPAGGTTNLLQTPTFSWAPVSGALGYLLEIDDNADFSSPLLSTTVFETSYTPNFNLNAGTRYFWRVTASNACGGNTTAAQEFTTALLQCQSFANNTTFTIGTAANARVDSPITSTLVGTVRDVNVTMRGTHTWIEDLGFYLFGPTISTVSPLFAGVCGNNDNFDLTLDDSAPGEPQGWPCTPIPMGQGGTWKPADPLAWTYNGIPAQGAWQLTVVDFNAGDGGSLTHFGLELCVDQPNSLVLAADDRYTTAEDTTLSVSAPGLAQNDSPSGLTLTVLSPPSQGNLTAFPGTGAFTYVPQADFCGSDSFTYSASNGSASDTATVTLEVSCVNDAPVAQPDSYNTPQNTALTVAAPGVLGNDTDAESDPLSAVLVSSVSNGSLSLNADGSFTYTPNTNYSGPDSFTYKANDGALDSNTVTVSLTVNAVNTAPVAVADSYSTNQNITLTVNAPGVLGNDTDANGDALTAILVSTTSNGTLTLNSNGSFTYVPITNYTGPDSFTYKANDGALDSNTVTVSLTVNAVNTAPVAVADSYSTAEDTPLNVAAPGVLANDTDAENNTLTAILVSNVSHGTLSLNANGGFTYMPSQDYNGPDSFTYKANDGALDSNTVTVSLTVTPVNDAPVAVADSYSTAEDTPLTVAAPGVLANDTDAENNTLTAILVSTTSNGTLTLNANGSFSYLPNANYNGPDSFTYKANDGALDSNTVTVSLTVTPVNDAPVAVADSYSTAEDTPLNVAAPGVLANDTDAENNTLTAILVSTTSNGTLSLNANGSFTYTPNSNYNGPDSFTYKANDGALDSNTVTVSLTVTPVNDAPTFTGEPYAFGVPANSAAGTAVGTISAVDVDTGQTLTFAITGGNTGAAFALNASTGAITVANAAAVTTAASPFTLAVEVRDNGVPQLSDTSTVTITVSSVNAAPTVTSLPNTVVTATFPASIATAQAFTDPDGDTLSFSATGLPPALTMDAFTGLITGTAPLAQLGSYTVTVTATDPGHLSANTSFTLRVDQDGLFLDGFEDAR